MAEAAGSGIGPAASATASGLFEVVKRPLSCSALAGAGDLCDDGRRVTTTDQSATGETCVALRRLLDFDAWAAGHTAEALAKLAVDESARHEVPLRAMALFAHNLAAHRVWQARVDGRTPGKIAWPAPRPAAFVEEVQKLRRRWDDVLGRHCDDDVIAYQDSRGRDRTGTLSDVVTHLVMHATYHRGQIAMLLGRVDVTLPATDFLLAVRDGVMG